MAEYRDLVKKGRERFKKELESILPDVKSGERLSGMHMNSDVIQDTYICVTSLRNCTTVVSQKQPALPNKII